MAVPGPTIAPENTGSGTAASPMARPARGDVTVVMESLRGGWRSVRVVTACPGQGTVEQGMSYEVPVPRERSRLAPKRTGQTICARSRTPCRVVLLLEDERRDQGVVAWQHPTCQILSRVTFCMSAGRWSSRRKRTDRVGLAG